MYLNNELFERRKVFHNNELNGNFFYVLRTKLKKNDIHLETIDIAIKNNIDLIIFFDYPSKKGNYFSLLKESYKKILITWEPPIINKFNFERKKHKYFDLILTWDDDLIDNLKYFKFFYPQPDFVKPLKVDYHSKRLCTLIAGNKCSYKMNELYSKRLDEIDFFEKNRGFDFDFYGRGWKGLPDCFGTPILIKIYNKIIRLFFDYGKKNLYRNYKGVTNKKLETLSKYKFTICYENQTNLNGYLTEKIFDCFFAGSVPIYLGCENIEKYIPKDCFIDRGGFDSTVQLVEYIASIDENLYNNYIDSINKYLISDNYKQVSETYLNRLILNYITKLKL